MLFLDEPTTGLDTRSRRELWDVIRSLADAGTTVFLTTQYLEEADRLADRVAVLDDGRIVADGTPAALKSRIGGDVVELRDDEDRAAPRDPHRRHRVGSARARSTISTTPPRSASSPCAARASTTSSCRSRAAPTAPHTEKESA